MMMMREVADLCRRVRLDEGVPQKDVADWYGVHQTTILRFERGKIDSWKYLAWYVLHGLRLRADLGGPA